MVGISDSQLEHSAPSPALLSDPDLAINSLPADRTLRAAPMSWALPNWDGDPQTVIERCCLQQFRGETMQSLVSQLERAGIAVDQALLFRIDIALDEALKNSLIHGLLQIERSEDWIALRTSSGAELEKRFRAVNPIDGPREITVETSVTPYQIIVSIKDGGVMNSDLFAEKWNRVSECNAVIEALDAKIERGEPLSETEIAKRASILEVTNGRGFAYYQLGFDRGFGLDGEIILVKEISAAGKES